MIKRRSSVELQADGSTQSGLQFVSFQRSLGAFDTIFSRWMTNPAFENPGTGPDALLAAQGLQFQHGCFFFVPSHDDRYIAAGVFDPPVEPCRKVGHIVVRKRVEDANAQPVLAELGGFGFQVFKDNNPITAEFFTDSQGRARSPEVPMDVALELREVHPLANFTPAPNQAVTLDCPYIVVQMINKVTQPVPGYGG
jgi:hypothetical protein